MNTDRIDITIGAEKLQAVNAALTTLETELDFLVSLDPVESRRLVKMGLRNETFTRGVLEAAAQNATVIPQSVNLAAIQRDKTARDQLLPIQQRAQRLYERLTHTNAVLGADMYSGALGIYKAFRVFGRSAGLGLLIEELGRRFKKTPKTKTPAPAPGN